MNKIFSFLRIPFGSGGVGEGWFVVSYTFNIIMKIISSFYLNNNFSTPLNGFAPLTWSSMVWMAYGVFLSKAAVFFFCFKRKLENKKQMKQDTC